MYIRFATRSIHAKALALILLALAATCAIAQNDAPMRAMQDELKRSISQLRLQQMDKPYFLAYRMDEINSTTISAMLGSLTSTKPLRTRLIGVEIRVGDYALDNSNFMSPRSFGGLGGMIGVSQAPLDDNYEQIRRQFWLATDARYKKALEDLSAKRAALQMRKRSDEVPDFSKEPPATETEANNAAKADVHDLENLARELSGVFKSTPEIFSSSVVVNYNNVYTRYVNSESSTFTRSQPVFKLQISAQTQAADGLPISDSLELYGRSIADLPAKDVLLARTRDMSARILKLRAAASIDRYNGPVLFEGEAAGEIFTQQFATGLMAVRAPSSDDPRFEVFFNQMMQQLGGSPSFTDKIGGRVLPEFLSVSDNPLLNEFKGSKLFGGYKIDDDAVKARETKLIDHGILKTVLDTRVPVKTVPHSTGSRRGIGPSPSNLLVTSDKAVSNEDLRKELLRRVKDRGLDYGIVVRRVGGGSASSFMRMASRMAAQSDSGSSAAIAEVYKLFPDGHEELVRGLEISEMTPAAFKDIVAVGDKPVVFTDEFMPRVGAIFAMGMTSASPDMPVVSCVIPSLLFEEVSLAKSPGPFPNPPISPSPLAKQ